MKYTEPQTNAPYAFAIGNLSRDDTQYEPGHGGGALIFGLRIRGGTDHAGRRDPHFARGRPAAAACLFSRCAPAGPSPTPPGPLDPPFAHGIAAVDRALDYQTILAS